MQQPQKAKGPKTSKKSVGKGKKKGSTTKGDLAQTLEANGPTDKAKVTVE